MGTDGALVASAVFKTVCVHVTHGWLGSIPRRSRNLGRECALPDSYVLRCCYSE